MVKELERNINEIVLEHVNIGIEVEKELGRNTNDTDQDVQELIEVIQAFGDTHYAIIDD